MPGAATKLTDDGEEVGRVQSQRLLVEPARRAEAREPDLDPGVLEAVAQHVERAAPADLGGDALQEPLLDVGTVVLREPQPPLGLRGEHEVEHVAGQQAELAIVVLRPAPAPRGSRGWRAQWTRFRLASLVSVTMAERSSRSIARCAVVKATPSRSASLRTVENGFSARRSTAFAGSRDGALATSARQRASRSSMRAMRSSASSAWPAAPERKYCSYASHAPVSVMPASRAL